MKKVFALICILSFAFFCNAQNSNTSLSLKASSKNGQKNTAKNGSEQVNPPPLSDTVKNAETISLKESEFNFGKIPQGKPVKHVFEFTNTGKDELSLNNVQASCGCTTPEWNKDPVPAGSDAKINVGYNAASEGPFMKTITITYNGTQTKVITIRGDVWKTPVASAPENSGLSSLKNQQ